LVRRHEGGRAADRRGRRPDRLLSAGAAGGATGAAGANAVTYFAAVSSVAVVSGTRVKGVASATTSGTGVYDVVLTATPNVTNCVAYAQLSGAAGMATATPSATQGHVTVNTFAFSGAPVNADFVVTVAC
jgi:hypothetical protein